MMDLDSGLLLGLPCILHAELGHTNERGRPNPFVTILREGRRHRRSTPNPILHGDHNALPQNNRKGHKNFMRLLQALRDL